MAKREVFEIRVGNQVVDTRSTWNASIRSIEKIVGKMNLITSNDFSISNNEMK